VFRAFLRDELKPMIAARYRTNGHDGVIGESLAGLFIAETWLREPGLFESYAAVSPSLWWDKEALSREAASLIGPRQAGHRLLLETASEGADMQVPVDRLVAALGGAKGWCYAPHADLTHATIYHAVSPTALQFLFPPATAPDPQTGFEIRCARTGAAP
jgi:predicted alpha/beta superfamily hydrolase